MQSSLAIVLSLTLGFSPYPCVSIFGTGHIRSMLEAFPGRRLSALPYSPWLSVRVTSSRLDIRICLYVRYLACSGSSVRRSRLPSPSLHRPLHECRNLHLLSIGYASRPRLRSRLTQSGRTFLWKPWVFGAWDSHPRSATHTGILSSICSTAPSGTASSLIERSPTTCSSQIHSFGNILSPGKLSAQSHSTSELLRTL